MERTLINTHILSSYSTHKYTHEHTEIHTNNKKISLLSTNSNARARAQKATSAPQTNKWREGKNAAKLNDKRNHKGKLICSIVIICFVVVVVVGFSSYLARVAAAADGRVGKGRCARQAMLRAATIRIRDS